MGFRDVVLSDRPVAFMPLDAGMAYDLGSQAVGQGSFTGVPICGVPGPPGMRGVTLDGSNYATAGSLPPGTSWTFEAWALPTDGNPAVESTLVSNIHFAGAGNWRGCALSIRGVNAGQANGSLFWGTCGGVGETNNIVASGLAHLNQWQHVVATAIQSGAQALWQDSVQIGSGTAGGSLGTGQPAYAGAFDPPAGNTRGFVGTLAMVAIYDMVLTPARIRAHYLAGRGFATARRGSRR